MKTQPLDIIGNVQYYLDKVPDNPDPYNDKHQQQLQITFVCCGISASIIAYFLYKLI